MAVKSRATDDTATTNEDTLINIAVLSNDIATPSQTMTVYSLSTISVVTTEIDANGSTIIINANGTISYDPTTSSKFQSLAQGETATDTFTYVMKESNPSGAFTLNSAIVTVTLTGVNDAPVINGAVAKQSATDITTIKPFSTVQIDDVDHNASDSLTIQLLDKNGTPTDANGTLSGAGLSKVTGTAGTYVLSATSPSNLSSEVDQLVFTPTEHQEPAGTTVFTRFSLAANDGFTTTTNLDTTVFTTQTAPNIIGYNLTIVDAQNPINSGGIVDDTVATDINDSGEVVGIYDINTDANGLNGQSFGFKDIGGIISTVVVPGSFDTSVSKVNNNGDITGIWRLGNVGPLHGFVQFAGSTTFTALPEAFTNTTGDIVIPKGISDAGTVVYEDFQQVANGTEKSFSYDAAGNLKEITVSGADETDVEAISDNGSLIVGDFRTGLQEHGFIMTAGNTKTYDVPNSIATEITAVNDFGDVAGTYADQTDNVHGFILSRTGQLTLLPDFVSITGLSDDSVAVGTANGRAVVYTNGKTIDVSPNFTTIAHTSSINNSNAIAGDFSTSANGLNLHGFVGTPITA